MQYKVLINSVKGLRKLVPYDDNFYTTAITSLGEKKEGYESIYIYNQEHYDLFNETKTLSGIKNVVTDKVVFDFDSKTDLKKAFSDTKTLVNRLKADGFLENEISVAYSSSKGTHVEVAVKGKTFTREEFEAITQSYAGDLETFDTAISDEQRIFRLPLSYNAKSGGYKIPLVIEDLDCDIADIVEYAKDPDMEQCVEMLGNIVPAQNKFKVKKKAEKKVEVVETDYEDFPNFSVNRTGLTNAKYALACGFFEEGERHEAVVILAATYRALGWTFPSAYENIKASVRQRNERLSAGELSETEKEEIYLEVSSVYSINWKGGTFSEDTGLLKKVKERYKIEDRFDENKIIGIYELRNATEKFLKDLKNNRIYTGLSDMDKNLILTRGMMFGALGSPGSGKTSFLNLFMKNTSKNDGPCLYFSADMSKDLLGIKIMQNYTGYSIEKLEDMILHKTFDKKYLDAVELFTEDYKNVGFCFENGLTVEDVSNEMKKFEDKLGKRISLTGIDYLEKIMGPFSEETANSGYVAANLSNLAKKHETCMGVLLQPNKQSGSPADEFKSYRSIKGASKIEQDARAIIGIWRPGYDPENYVNDRYMSIAILKQNMGRLGRFDYNWEGATGSIREMSGDDKKAFKSYMEELQNLKAEEDSGGGFKKFGSKNKDSY